MEWDVWLNGARMRWDASMAKLLKMGKAWLLVEMGKI